MTHTVIAYVLIALLGFLVFLLSRQVDQHEEKLDMLATIVCHLMDLHEEDIDEKEDEK